MCMRSNMILLMMSCFLITEAAPSTCNSVKTCVECVQQSSWTGSVCNWCDIDHECHADLALLTNPCSNTQQIANVSKCKPYGKYQTFDEQYAYKMLRYASAAYQMDPSQCFDAELDGIDIKEVSTVSCDLFGNTCIGFSALDYNLEHIVIAFKGSSGLSQAAMIAITSTGGGPTVDHVIGGQVNRYFSAGFEKMWECMELGVVELVRDYPKFNVSITGHSLGGAFATLAAAKISASALVPHERIRHLTFGQPRVGDYNFAKNFCDYVPYSWRVVHGGDFVAHFPPCTHFSAFAFCTTILGGYYHVGWEVLYGPDMTLGKQWPDGGYKLCTGWPFMEDQTCSNKLEPAYVYNHHINYYNHKVSTFCMEEPMNTSSQMTTIVPSSSTTHLSTTTVTESQWDYYKRITFPCYPDTHMGRMKSMDAGAYRGQMCVPHVDFRVYLTTGNGYCHGSNDVRITLLMACRQSYRLAYRSLEMRIRGQAALDSTVQFANADQVVEVVDSMTIQDFGNNDPIFLKSVIVDIVKANYTFTINQWFGGDSVGSTTPSIYPDSKCNRSRATAEYIISVKTGSSSDAGIEFQGIDAVAVFENRYYRSSPVKLNTAVRGFPRVILPGFNNTKSFTMNDMGKIERIYLSIDSCRGKLDDWFIDAVYLLVLHPYGKQSYYYWSFRKIFGGYNLSKSQKPTISIYSPPPSEVLFQEMVEESFMQLEFVDYSATCHKRKL